MLSNENIVAVFDRKNLPFYAFIKYRMYMLVLKVTGCVFMKLHQRLFFVSVEESK